MALLLLILITTKTPTKLGVSTTVAYKARAGRLKFRYVTFFNKNELAILGAVPNGAASLFSINTYRDG